MRQRLPVGKKAWIGGLALLVVLAAAFLTWIERDQWWGRYAVYRLTRSDEAGRDLWIERVIEREAVGLPALVACLTQDDTRACSNAQAALERLAVRWPADDERRAKLTDQLADGFAHFSPPGRCATLELATSLTNSRAESTVSTTLTASMARLLTEAAHQTDSAIRTRGLALAEMMLQPAAQPEVVTACCELIQTCLQDNTAANRIRAIELGTQPPLNLLAQVIPLLRDPAPEVRRAALLAVGPVPEVLGTDDLLAWLHDPDSGVRRLCEKALQGRGLRDDHIQLGRFLTAEDARTRLKVLDRLRQTTELEPGVWLRRLSQDSSPAVRAAALRAAMEFTQVDLRDRMEQVVQDDPSPTVRQLAAFYLSCRKTQDGPIRTAGFSHSQNVPPAK
jgi:hypothetical protein